MALERFSPLPFTVRFQRSPFILRPDRVGLEKWRDVLKQLSYQRVGSDRWYTNFIERMTVAGKEAGIDFNFDGEVGNSFHSLRLLEWAATLEENKQEALASQLAIEHFEKANCVCKRDTLLGAIRECKINETEAIAVLDDTDRYNAQVQKKLLAHARGAIHSIPVFNFQLLGPHPNVIATSTIHGSAGVSEYEKVISNFVNRC